MRDCDVMMNLSVLIWISQGILFDFDLPLSKTDHLSSDPLLPSTNPHISIMAKGKTTKKGREKRQEESYKKTGEQMQTKKWLNEREVWRRW